MISQVFKGAVFYRLSQCIGTFGYSIFSYITRNSQPQSATNHLVNFNQKSVPMLDCAGLGDLPLGSFVKYYQAKRLILLAELLLTVNLAQSIKLPILCSPEVHMEIRLFVLCILAE
jgi:hypothetical protein